MSSSTSALLKKPLNQLCMDKWTRQLVKVEIYGIINVTSFQRHRFNIIPYWRFYCKHVFLHFFTLNNKTLNQLCVDLWTHQLIKVDIYEMINVMSFQRH
jgi:hypothetical protein